MRLLYAQLDRLMGEPVLIVATNARIHGTALRVIHPHGEQEVPRIDWSPKCRLVYQDGPFRSIELRHITRVERAHPMTLDERLAVLEGALGGEQGALIGEARYALGELARAADIASKAIALKDETEGRTSPRVLVERLDSAVDLYRKGA